MCFGAFSVFICLSHHAINVSTACLGVFWCFCVFSIMKFMSTQRSVRVFGCSSVITAFSSCVGVFFLCFFHREIHVIKACLDVFLVFLCVFHNDLCYHYS